MDAHLGAGWREKLLSSTAAAAVALAVAGMSVAAYPPPSIAAAAAAAEVGGFTEGPLDALQRQLRETDRALTRSLRKAQAAVADGIQAIAPPTRNVNGVGTPRCSQCENAFGLRDYAALPFVL